MSRRFWIPIVSVIGVVGLSAGILFAAKPAVFDELRGADAATAARRQADQAYKAIQLPEDWELQSGGSIDKAANILDRPVSNYNYQVPGRPDGIYRTVQDLSKRAGFTIVNAEGPDQTDDGTIGYYVSAEKADVKTKVVFNITGEKAINLVAAEVRVIQ